MTPLVWLLVSALGALLALLSLYSLKTSMGYVFHQDGNPITQELKVSRMASSSVITMAYLFVAIHVLISLKQGGDGGHIYGVVLFGSLATCEFFNCLLMTNIVAEYTNSSPKET